MLLLVGVRISISEEGRVTVIAKDKASYDQAKDMVTMIKCINSSKVDKV